MDRESPKNLFLDALHGGELELHSAGEQGEVRGMDHESAAGLELVVDDPAAQLDLRPAVARELLEDDARSPEDAGARCTP
jgi:hypothetical protein